MTSGTVPRRGSGRPGRFLLLLPILLALCVCPVADGRENEEAEHAGTGGPVPATSTPEAEYAAALRASECLLAAAPDLDRTWSLATYDRLYKIAPTEELAARFKAAFDAAAAEPVAALPESLDSPELLEPQALRPIAMELWRRRMTGGEWADQAAALEALVARHESELWAPLPLTQRLVTIHLLSRIDVDTRMQTASIAQQLRQRWTTGDRARLVRTVRFMYPVTHVIYVDSGYGDRFLDPAEYPVEVEILDTALADYAASFPTNPTFIHLAFEVLAARRFLKQPDSPDARAVKAELLALQGKSGCWRPGSGTDTIHATREAVHALGRYPSELRSLTPPMPAPP